MFYNFSFLGPSFLITSFHCVVDSSKLFLSPVQTGTDLARLSPCPSCPSSPWPQLHTSVCRVGNTSWASGTAPPRGVRATARILGRPTFLSSRGDTVGQRLLLSERESEPQHWMNLRYKVQQNKSMCVNQNKNISCTETAVTFSSHQPGHVKHMLSQSRQTMKRSLQAADRQTLMNLLLLHFRHHFYFLIYNFAKWSSWEFFSQIYDFII